MSVSMESCEGEVALDVEGESSRDSELPLTFIHSITVVPVAVLEPERDLEKRTEKKRSEVSVFVIFNYETTIIFKDKVTKCSFFVFFLPVRIVLPLSQLPVSREGQLCLSLPVWCLDLQTWRSIMASMALLPLTHTGFGGTRRARQQEIRLEVWKVVPGDVQALWPAIPVKSTVVDSPLGFSKVLHERDAPHRRWRLALGFLK